MNLELVFQEIEQEACKLDLKYCPIECRRHLILNPKT